MGGVNQVSIPCHHEAKKSDTHFVLIEEDVGMGAVWMREGRRGRREAMAGQTDKAPGGVGQAHVHSDI